MQRNDDGALLGIHHVTAISGAAQGNLDFYSEVLGLRLVKLTVNFDDPSTYHLYYGGGEGRPGTVVTFFPWPGVRPGRMGSGQATTTGFSIPAASLGYWTERLRRLGVPHAAPRTRISEEVLTLLDPDGLALELVAHEARGVGEPWEGGPVPADHAVRGLHSATLSLTSLEATAGLLIETLGFRIESEGAGRLRLAAGHDTVGGTVDLIRVPSAARGVVGAGSVHHIAWRVAGDEEQAAWRCRLLDAGVQVTPVADRRYFRSIYFREPGGVLFEIATDPPGFALDESIENLGSALKLPEWLEAHRAEIESRLPALRMPARHDA